MNVVVVGGLDRMQDQYRRILNGYGNRMLYVSGDELGARVGGKVEQSDVVMLVTAGLTHKVTEKVRALLGDRPLVYVNTRGVTGFKKAAKELTAMLKRSDVS